MKVFFRARRGLEVATLDLPDGLLKVLKEAFTHANPDFHKKKNLGLWTGNTPRTVDDYEIAVDDWGNDWLILPRGGAEKIRRTLAARGYVADFFDERFEGEEVDFDLRPGADPVTMRGHQERIIEAALKHENALARSATGSGKTEAALEFIRRARRNAVVIVWTSSLLKQWIDRIHLRWGWPIKEIGRWEGSTHRLGKVTVAMQQSLVNPDHLDLFARTFGTVVCDEVQKFAAKTFLEVISEFPARYRLGVSADERRKDGKDFLIRDHFGPPVVEVPKEELIAVGHLCEVDVVIVPTGFRYPAVEDAPPEERKELLVKHYSAILKAMQEDADRNAIATKLAAFEVRRRDSSTIVFCERVAHVRKLAREIAVVEKVPCGVMLGQKKNQEAFEEAKARLTSGELQCAVAGKSAYRGEDIPRLSTGVVVTPTGNNKYLFEQQTGRLRRKHGTKVRGTLYYLWDEGLFPRVPENLRKWYPGLVTIRELGDVIDA